MSENPANIEQLNKKIESSDIPNIQHGIHLLPVSHKEFQARWSLSETALESGRQVASHDGEEAQLVLRAYCLPKDSSHTDFSTVWQDFTISGTENCAYFTLPAPVEKVNAAVGLINKSGRFSPLVRGEAVALPFAPAPNHAPTADHKAPTELAVKSTHAPASSEQPQTIFNEEEIAQRLRQIKGLPDSFKSKHIPEDRPIERQSTDDVHTALAQDKLSGFHPAKSCGVQFDETSILEIVRQKMAVDPEPADLTPKASGAAESDKDSSAASHGNLPDSGGASEQLASQWEDMWSGKAPVEIHATFILSGKIAPEMKILLGNEILSPTPGGYLIWKRNLHAFHQIWPLLEAALSCPSVPAGPVLEFFKDVTPSERLLELHAALEIEGKLTDPTYRDKLPSGLRIDADGQFKMSRMLPDGAVILPGLSMVVS